MRKSLIILPLVAAGMAYISAGIKLHDGNFDAAFWATLCGVWAGLLGMGEAMAAEARKP